MLLDFESDCDECGGTFSSTIRVGDLYHGTGADLCFTCLCKAVKRIHEVKYPKVDLINKIKEINN